MREQDSQLLVETTAIGPAFEELLDLAVDTCIFDDLYQEALADIKVRDDRGPSRQVQKLGLWSLRGSLEKYVNGPMILDETKPSDNEALSFEDEEALEYAEQVASHFNGESEVVLPIDPAIQDKIEAFGEALLDEAFLCLGSDAPEKVAQFKRARSLNTKVKVCNWLIQRISDIQAGGADFTAKLKEEDMSAEELEEYDREITQGPTPEYKYFYHPARLSPNFIGIYPENRMEPTCLGLSILVAAFFQKAGVPYLHAGVATEASRELRFAQSSLIREVQSQAKDWGVPIPPDLNEELQRASFDSDQHYFHNAGWHACVLARLKYDKWLQIDPNFHSNIVLDQCDPLELLSASVGDPSMRGAESMVISPAGLNGTFFLPMLDNLRDQSLALEEIDRFLAEVPAETAHEQIIEKFFGVYSNEDDPASRAVIFFCGQVAETLGLSAKDYIKSQILVTLKDYVFADADDESDITSSVARCKVDPAYRQRRAEDLKLAPLFALLKFQSAYVNEAISNSISLPHTLIEAGAPAYRIAMCVLSDFAAYCGDKLPLSFWATYWPSHIALAEHYEQISSDAQMALAHRIIDSIKKAGLTYPSIYDKISLILEQERR